MRKSPFASFDMRTDHNHDSIMKFMLDGVLYFFLHWQSTF